MKRLTYKAALLALLITTLSGCGSEQPRSEKPAIIVSSFEVKAPVAEQFRNFKGAVIPADLTPLAFRIEGELTDILVKSGQQVKQGQLLAKLDDDKIKQQLIDAKAQFELADKQYQRGLSLSKNSMISALELDQLTASKRIAEVNLKSAQYRLNYSELVAPFDGFISDVPKKNFESVYPGEMILSIYRDDVVHVRIGVSDVVLAMVNPRATAHYANISTSFAGDDRNFKIKYLEHTSEPIEGGNAYEIILEMAQITPNILPGTSANLDVDMSKIGLAELKGYQIPMTAIDSGTRKGQFMVWKYQDGKALKSPIEILAVNKDGAVAFKGVEQGDLLINSKLKKLRNEVSVKLAAKDK